MSIKYLIPYFIFCCLYSIISAHGQLNHMSIRGQVFDSINWKVPADIRLYILDKDDTISTAAASDSGYFHLPCYTKADTLVLLAKAPDYNTSQNTFHTGVTIDLDTVYINPVHVLNEITIQSGYKIRIDRDTASFTADSFLIRQFDNAAQLMEKIPGMEVTPGKGIRYYGQPIQEISIDGIPFSNFDNQSLLKLLRGRDIDKLKIYDTKPDIANNFRQSSQAEKAINIVLKEEAKHGYFGKLAAGAGRADQFHWDNNSNLSSFNDRRKIVAYTTSNNTGGANSFGESALAEQDVTEAPRGVPTNINAGIHYDRRFLNNRLSMNSNYSIGYNNQDAQTETVDINFLPSNTITTTARSGSGSKTIANRATIQASYRIDSFSSISLVVNTGISFFENSTQNNSVTTTTDNTVVNTSRFGNAYNGHSPQTSFTLSYARTFRNRSNLICSFAPYRSSNTTDATQYSITELPGQGDAQKTSQKKKNRESNNAYAFTSLYKIPMAKHINAEIAWNAGLSRSGSLVQAYDQYPDGDNHIKDSLNPLYSTDYRFLNLSNNINARISMRRKKYTAQIGMDIRQALWQQQDAYSGTDQKRNFMNALPFAGFSITTGKGSFANINYKLQATQPTFSQIQPLINNNNPLKVIIGNPALVQSLSHNISGSYTATSKDGSRSFNASSSFSIIKNAISLRQAIDENGRETVQYYNQDGNYVWSIASGYDCSSGSGIRISATANVNQTKTVAWINNATNAASVTTYNPGLSFTYTSDTTLSISFSTAIAYIVSSNSLTPVNNKIRNCINTFNATYSTPLLGICLGTSLLWNNTISSTDNNNRNYFIWNAYLQRCLNTSQSLSIKLYGHDLLNQNKGYLVYTDNNVQHKETYNSVQRYFLLGLVWHFTKR